MLSVLDPGVLTTVQDLGRVGWRAWGVGPGGAFDRVSHTIANALIGNRPECATLEMTGVGGTYLAHEPMALGLAGAPMRGVIFDVEGHPRADLAIPQSLSLRPGERLVLGGTARGFRTYLAVVGGWDEPLRFGSRSQEKRLERGVRLRALHSSRIAVHRPSPDLESAPDDDAPIRIMAGPEAGPDRMTALESREWKIDPRSDRMGLRLVGSSIEANTSDPDRLSAPVAPGAVQWTPSGPIVLGPACGTIGGYPHVAQVLTSDLDRLGQARPGSAMRFRYIAWEDARRIEREARRNLRRTWLRLSTRCAPDPFRT